MKIKFSMRDLLFVVVICAMAVGWYFGRTAQKQKYDDVMKGTQPVYVQTDHGTFQERTIRIKVGE